MPLPYAPPPKDSKVYRDLKNLKISDVTADQMDTLKGELFAQGVDGSEDEMRRLNLLGRVSNQASTSGPIPGTGLLVKHDQTTNDVQTVYRPAVGEVYLLMGADASAFGTGQNGATLSLSDGTNVMVIADSSSAGDMNDHGFRGGAYIDNALYLTFQPNNISSGTATVEVALIRVR